jgi:predicted transcriptional regulator
MIDELIDENTIRSSKIQFIFEESIRLEIDSIVVLSEVKNFKEIVCRCRFDDDHVDEQIENLLHESSINQKSDEFDLKNSIDQCEFISTRDTQRRHCELR